MANDPSTASPATNSGSKIAGYGMGFTGRHRQPLMPSPSRRKK
jgi:hypothetical protein